MCNATVTGLNIRSSEVEFHPGPLNGGEYTADAITAG